MKKNRGVIYIAIGKKYVEEAIHSCLTLKKNNNINATIFTNRIVQNDIFDDVVLIESIEHPWKLKVKALLLTPYDETLFLDTDTEIRGNIENPFDLLEKFDFVLAPVRDYKEGKLEGFTKILQNRSDIPRLNTGVIYFKKSHISFRFLEIWYERVGKISGTPQLGIDCDQNEFNKMLSEKIDNEMAIKVSTILNYEYNCRLYFLPHLNKRQMKNIKIIHQHYLNIQDLRKYYYNFPIYKRVFIEKIRVVLGKRLIS